MKLVIPELEISPEEGFTQNDIFKRAGFGERLANLIHANEGSVLALDSGWGEGKSTFIKMWCGHVEHIRDNKFKTLYFDAFANDYQRDPFLALVSAIYKFLEEAPEEIKKTFKEQASKVGMAMLRGGLRLGTKLATGGIIDEEAQIHPWVFSKYTITVAAHYQKECICSKTNTSQYSRQSLDWLSNNSEHDEPPAKSKGLQHQP